MYVSQLRKALGRDLIVTQPPGYLIRVSDGELDLHRFERLVATARAEEPAQAARLLREALALWRGAPLAELGDSFARAERARLEEQRLAALEQRIEAELALGRHAELVPELEGLVREHPLRERLRGQLMLALYRCGRQADALEVYRSGGGCWTRSSGSSRTMSSNASREPSSTTILRSSRRSSPGSNDPLSHSVAERRHILRRRFLPTRSL